MAESRENCFSCSIKVGNLQEPLDLSGRWLFTRDDLPKNSRPDTNTSSWTTIETPGPWNKAYADGEMFEVGWYRGHFEFHPRLIGKKAVFYVNAHMSRMQIFLDGVEIMRRKGRLTHERYQAIQPIPVVFKITRTRHVIAMRIDTRLMLGIHELPFQLRPYRSFDPGITFRQLLFVELRYLSAYVLLAFGLFFLVVHARTRHGLYLGAGLAGIGIFPFQAFPHDSLVELFNPEKLWILHYVGLAGMTFGHVIYSQHFWKLKSRFNRINFMVLVALAGLLVAMTVRFEPAIFQFLRRLTLFYSIGMAIYLVRAGFHAFRTHPNLLILLTGEMIFLVCLVHDTLLDFGLIQSTSLIFIGALISTSAILFLTALIFGETFSQTHQLLDHAGELNHKLEQLVAVRTQELLERKNNLNHLLQILPDGLLTFDASFRVLPEYSPALERILETANIEGRDVFQLLFVHSSVPLDVQAALRDELIHAFGSKGHDFKFNGELSVKEFAITIRGTIKMIALGWSSVTREDNQLSRVLVSVRDVTAVRLLEQESQRARLQLRIIEAVMQDSLARLQEFIGASRNALQPFVDMLEKESLTAEQLGDLIRELHAIHDQARMLDLLDLAGNAHWVEEKFGEWGRRDEVPEKDKASELLQDLIHALDPIEEAMREVLMRLEGDGLQTTMVLPGSEPQYKKR